MKLDEPIGPTNVGPLLIRLTIGAYFILAGLEKIDKVPVFVQVIQDFDMINSQLAVLYGHLLPPCEIVVGIMLVCGVWSTLSAIMASVMLLTFIAAFGTLPHYGEVARGGIKFVHFNKDIILLASTASLIYTGPGAFSYDAFLRK